MMSRSSPAASTILSRSGAAEAVDETGAKTESEAASRDAAKKRTASNRTKSALISQPRKDPIALSLPLGGARTT
jgi:hypothetical protein